ncbi:MAG: type II CAAX endopeptidase family protein [Clostridia bacterium]
MLKRTYLTPNDSYICFAVSLFAFLSVSFFGGICIMVFASAKNSILLIFTMLSTLALAVAPSLYFNVYRVDIVKATRLKDKPKLLPTLAGIITVIGLVAVMMPIVIFFNKLLVGAGASEPSVELPINLDTIWGILLAVLAVCILPAICEEFLLRGVVARGLSRFGIVWASIISGVLFMLMHMNVAQTLYQFAFGAILGYIALSGGGIWLCVILHFFNNFLALLLDILMPLAVQETVFVTCWYITIPVGLVIMALGILFYLKTNVYSFDKNEELNALQSNIDNVEALKQAQNTAQPSRLIINTKTEIYPDLINAEPQNNLDRTTFYLQKPELSKPSLGAKIFFGLSVIICVVMWISTLFI